jgi:hypothetical protein
MESTLDEARAAKPHVQKAFEGKADVVGLGITKVGEGYGVKVNLSKEPKPGVDLPKSVNGVPVKVEVVGPIRKQ